MSVKSAPFYWLICDGCGEKSTEGGDYDSWSDENGAIEDALNSDWVAQDGEHFCFDCQVDDSEGPEQ